MALTEAASGERQVQGQVALLISAVAGGLQAALSRSPWVKEVGAALRRSQARKCPPADGAAVPMPLHRRAAGGLLGHAAETWPLHYGSLL